uniref:Solute carrier family 28 member 3 n=1 Tax=Neolamprologus brichardi TaxID=32507 RepID=A0A3Q4H052_NEOBR
MLSILTTSLSQKRFFFMVDATHLLTATVMSAPASLAIAKMFWPETTVSRSNRPVKMDKGESKNLLEAASLGASRAIALVASVLANIIAFMALLAFFDAVLSWLGGMFDYPQLSFSLICSYVFMPLSFMMGVSFEDSFIVAELMGIKTFLNEFVAYQKLSELINRRKAGGPEYVNNVKQYISVSFIHVLTISLLIFSSSPIWFAQRSDISSCGLRALIAGSISCFMTACIAGNICSSARLDVLGNKVLCLIYFLIKYKYLCWIKQPLLQKVCIKFSATVY